MDEELIELRIEKKESNVTVTIQDRETKIIRKEELFGIDHVDKEGILLVTQPEANAIIERLRDQCREAFYPLEDEDDDDDDDEGGISSDPASEETVLERPISQSSKLQVDDLSYSTLEDTEEAYCTMSSLTCASDEEVPAKKVLRKGSFYNEKRYEKTPSDWAITAALFGTGLSLFGFFYVLKLYRRIVY